MRRPKPQLTKRKNLKRYYVARAREFAKEFSKYSGVVGVVLSGGVSRGYADRDSELDLTIFLTPKAHNLWVNKLQAPIPKGDTFYKGIYSSFGFEDIEEFRKKEIPYFKRWDLSYAKILYDTDGRVARAIKEKAVHVPLSNKELKAALNYGDSAWTKVWWYPDVAKIWLKRGDVLAAHSILNYSTIGILESLYLLNREFIAYDKWAAHLARSLPWLPKNFVRYYKQALLVKNLGPKEVLRRAKALKKLFAEMNVKYHKLPFVPIKEADVGAWLFKKKRVTLKEFLKKFPNNFSTLTGDPLARTVRHILKGKQVILEVDFKRVRDFLAGKDKMCWWSIKSLKQIYKKYKKI